MAQTSNPKALLERIAEADEIALGQLIDLYSPRLLAFCLRFTQNRTLAEELVQDAFIKLWNNREKLNDINTFEAYIFTMAKHLCLDYLRVINKERELKSVISQNIVTTHNPVDDFLLDKHYEHILMAAINTLPKRQKEVFEMSRQDGKSHKEIAQILGISAKTVDEHISRALKTIKKRLFSYSNLFPIFLLTFFC